MVYTLDQLASELNVDESIAQKELSDRSLSLADLDSEIVAALKSEMFGGKTAKSDRPKTRSNGSALAKQTPGPTPRATGGVGPGVSKATAQSAVSLFQSPDSLVKATLDSANAKASQRLEAEMDATSDRLADVIVAQAQQNIAAIESAFLSAFTAGSLINAIEGTAVDLGYVDVEVID